MKACSPRPAHSSLVYRAAPSSLLTGLLLAEAAVTAVLNLDTAVVFMTPVLLQAARHRGLADGPFLYGAVFMANSASLLLPGSNLTNLIVLANEHVSGTTFAARLAPAFAVSVVLTIAFVAVAFRRELASDGGGDDLERPRLRAGAGVAGVVVATVLVLVLARPALPVLVLGVAVAIGARLGVRDARRAANPVLLLGVLAAAVLLGTVARAVDVGRLVDHAGRWQTAGVARRRVGARQQPARGSDALCARARASAGAALRPRSGTEPRGQRLALGDPLASGRARQRRATVDRAVLTARRVPGAADDCGCAARQPSLTATIAALAGVVSSSVAASRGSRRRNSRTGSPSTGLPGVRSSLTTKPPGAVRPRMNSQS